MKLVDVWGIEPDIISYGNSDKLLGHSCSRARTLATVQLSPNWVHNLVPSPVHSGCTTIPHMLQLQFVNGLLFHTNYLLTISLCTVHSKPRPKWAVNVNLSASNFAVLKLFVYCLWVICWKVDRLLASKSKESYDPCHWTNLHAGARCNDVITNNFPQQSLETQIYC